MWFWYCFESISFLDFTKFKILRQGLCSIKTKCSSWNHQEYEFLWADPPSINQHITECGRMLTLRALTIKQGPLFPLPLLLLLPPLTSWCNWPGGKSGMIIRCQLIDVMYQTPGLLVWDHGLFPWRWSCNYLPFGFPWWNVNRRSRLRRIFRKHIHPHLQTALIKKRRH